MQMAVTPVGPFAANATSIGAGRSFHPSSPSSATSRFAFSSLTSMLSSVLGI
jgi:hypothetical protein